jgi:signal transduction histidine kinase
VFIIGRDVTDEKALEARVRRTEKLAAVGTLAAGLAHEIRNPLNGAQLHLTYLNRALAKHDAHEELNEAVDIVTSEIQRLSELVTDFLEFARPRGLRRQSVSIQALCIRSKDLLATDSTGRVSVELDMPDAEVIAEVDPDMIEQVLLNLLTNAVQAVKGNDNGGKVTLRVRRRPRQVTLAVIDDGPGLPDESAPIFDAFYSSKATGTGLGLSIVHRIVTDHGGAIAVDSKPGCTCFELTLPLIDPERTHTGAPPPIHTSTRT